MKTVVGFTFTETPIHRLIEQGFSLSKNENTLQFGYREFICPFSPQQGTGHSLEFREIIDENIYFQFQKKRDLSPFESESKHYAEEVQHPNQIYCVNDIFGADMPVGELKEYLKIRKTHSIWMLWLKCSNWDKFKLIAQPNLFFNWQKQQAALIHLGQSCFDILVTPD